MSAWVILYTGKAESDLEAIFEYLAFELQEPNTAKKQLVRILDAIEALSHMPFRYRLYDKEPWTSKGVRVLTVQNYLVFYQPNEQTSAITIIRIMYGGRDIESELI